jgi:exodeoxyribonuclease VII small subunit
MTAAADDTAPDQTALSFEQILEGLSAVVEQLESGEAPLEQSLAIFEQGVKLSRLGSRRLDEAERRIEMLLNTNGEVSTAPFDKE